MTSRYGSKLNFEKELGLRLKGENGIMKKKFSALQKDIEDQREEIRTMFAHKKELYQVCLICKLYSIHPSIYPSIHPSIRPHLHLRYLFMEHTSSP